MNKKERDWGCLITIFAIIAIFCFFPIAKEIDESLNHYLSKLLLTIWIPLYHWGSFLQGHKTNIEENVKLYNLKIHRCLIPLIFLSVLNLFLIENWKIFTFNMITLAFYFENYERILYDVAHKDFIVKKLEKQNLIDENEFQNEVYPL